MHINIVYNYMRKTQALRYVLIALMDNWKK